jgi:hypothetical protein
MDMTLRWQGPWESEDLDQIPEGHEILAEFPSVVWGWECDLYQWILRAPDGRRYIGGTSHGRFHEVKLADISEATFEHYEMAYLLEKVFTSITQP